MVASSNHFGIRSPSPSTPSTACRCEGLFGCLKAKCCALLMDFRSFLPLLPQ